MHIVRLCTTQKVPAAWQQDKNSGVQKCDDPIYMYHNSIHKDHK